MYQPFHKLRVRFAELEMKQGEVAKRAKVLGIPTDQIGTFFFEDAPKGGKGAA